MSKESELKDALDELLPEPLATDAKILLWQFIKVFKLKKHHDNTGGWWKKLYYKALALPLLVDGYIRDVRINSTVGRMLFGDYAGEWYQLGTLTATLKRVQIASSVPVDKVMLARQICQVLNESDPNHC